MDFISTIFIYHYHYHYYHYHYHHFLLSPAGSGGLSQPSGRQHSPTSNNQCGVQNQNQKSKSNQQTLRQDTKLECELLGRFRSRPIKLSIKRKFHARVFQRALSLALPNTKSQAKKTTQAKSDILTSQAESKSEEAA